METKNTQAVVAEATETKVETVKTEKKAVKRVAPKKVEKKAEPKKAEATPKKAAPKKAEPKKEEKAPKASLRDEAEALATKVKKVAHLTVRCYEATDAEVDKESEITLEMRQRNPFVISAARWGEVRNMVIAIADTPITESDKSRRGSLWELCFKRGKAEIIMGDTLYAVAERFLKEVPHNYKREAGWDLKNLVSLPKDFDIVGLLNNLNAVYAKMIAK